VSDRLSVERRGVNHGALPVAGGSTRCACPVNTFDTRDYGCLNAIRFRAVFTVKTDGDVVIVDISNYLKTTPEAPLDDASVFASMFPEITYMLLSIDESGS
jgi:hypothetical protein